MYLKQRKGGQGGRQEEVNTDAVIAQGILGGFVGAVGGAAGAIASGAAAAVLAGRTVATGLGAVMGASAADGMAGAVVEGALRPPSPGERSTRSAWA